jgi:Domain of unknown function (DUF4843)
MHTIKHFMKVILLSIVVGICLLTACKKQEIPLYDNSVSGSSIYFPLTDSTNEMAVSFGYAKSDVKDTMVSLIVRAIGAPVNTDRSYLLTIADSSTMQPEVDYKLLKKDFVIRAGKVADTLTFRLLRTTQLINHPLYLYLGLQPNEHFTTHHLSTDVVSGGDTATKYYTRLKITLDDIAGPPVFWAGNSPYYSYTVGYLGGFTTLKFQLLVNRYNLDVAELIQPSWFLTGSNYFRIPGWGSGLKNYLARMAAAGTPVYEADGITLMAAGPYAQ